MVSEMMNIIGQYTARNLEIQLHEEAFDLVLAALCDKSNYFATALPGLKRLYMLGNNWDSDEACMHLAQILAEAPSCLEECDISRQEGERR